MNKGTRFYKCDFQVHSPRDINWNGERAIKELLSDPNYYVSEEKESKCI